MSFSQAFLPVQIFANRYGRTERTFNAINFFRDASNANTSVNIDNSTFLATGNQGGKKREVKLVYFPISCDESGSCSNDVCDAGEVVEPKVMWFNITECTASRVFALNANDIRQVDFQTWDFNETALNIMMSELPAFRRKLAKAMITKAYALAGQHADGNETHNLNLIDAAGRINPLGMVKIEQEYDDLGLPNPYTLGGGQFFSFERMRNIGGLNDDGVFVNRSGLGNVFYDNALQGQLFNDLTNGDWALTVDPQTFKMITFSRNAGIFRTDLASIDDLATLRRSSTIGSIHGTFIDPATGLMYDFDAKYYDCDDQWRFQWRLEWDFFVMPEVVCNDTIGTVNGLMKWRTCPQVDLPCPTGVSPSTPATIDTFAWTPVLADLPTIYNSIIDGFVSQNNEVTIVTLADLAAYMTDNSNITFTVNGATIEYTGIAGSPISATFNNAAVTATFA